MKAQNKTKRSELIFDARKNFLDLKIVFDTLLLLTIVSAFAAVVIVFNSKIVADFSYSGFNYFLIIFKVPIAILALNIPIIAILAAFHKSEQTRLQIKLSDGQNLFANYFKHIEEFVKHIEKFESDDERFRCDARRLHYKLYPNAAEGDYDISDEMAAKMIDLIKYCKKISAGYDFDENIDINIVAKKQLASFYMDTKVLDYSIFCSSHEIIENIDFNSFGVDRKLVDIADCIGYVVWFFELIRHIISFNYSKKLTKKAIIY